MTDRIRQRLIAEKDFLINWLAIVLKASQLDLNTIKSNHDELKKAILSDWNGYDISYINIRLDFFNERACSSSSDFKNQLYRISFNFYWENDYLVLDIRKDSIDAEGYHACPQDEEYLICSCFHEKDEFTFFEDDATKKFLEIYQNYQKIYPNKELPDIETDITF